MKKSNKIIYWATTIFLSVGMTAGGLQQMFQTGGYNDIATTLGYPLYLLTILGVWKILGVVVILIPKFTLVKEWAYAGFFFAMSGALVSHLVVELSFVPAIPSFILLCMTVISWYFRPASRKVSTVQL